MKVPYLAFYRVWIALQQDERRHTIFHAALWSAKIDGPRATALITARVSESPAAEPDRVAVLHHLAEDWENARVLASMASACTCWAEGDFPARLRSLREAAGLSVQELAEAASLTRQAVHALEAGERRPAWDTVQALAAALKVTTDTFRDRE